MRRWRKTVLWIGCTSCVLIAAAFVASAWWRVRVAIPGGPTIGVQAGKLEVYSHSAIVLAGYRRHRDGLRFALSRMTTVSLYASVGEPILMGVTLPLVYPFLAVAVPTLLAWRFWPKPPKPGHCRCGYDLTGLTEPRCPECGQPFEAKGEAP